MVFGPLLESGKYILYKLASRHNSQDTIARASHILIKSEDKTPKAKAKAKKEAQGILDQVKRGAPFDVLAEAHGSDGTAKKGGDLGWFGKGRMVAPFERAVFKARRTGLLPRVIETDFGYHIVKVTGLPTTTKYAVAKIARDIWSPPAKPVSYTHLTLPTNREG